MRLRRRKKAAWEIASTNVALCNDQIAFLQTQLQCWQWRLEEAVQEEERALKEWASA